MDETGSKEARGPADADEAYWGLCPICRHNDGYLNLLYDHWFVCDEHRVKWCVGADLFSSWRDESPDVWADNWDRLKGYAEVEPELPERPAKTEGKCMEDRGPDIREMTRNLVLALKLDIWPSRATCADFGIQSEAHLGALQFAVLQDGVTEEQLDAALGKGAEIQKLISPKNPYRHAVFRTSWDDMPTEPDDL